MATSGPMTDDGKEVIRVPYIHYPVKFREEQIRALLDSGREINTMNPIFAQKLGLKVWKTNVGAKVIDGSALETFWIVIR